jgi:hypothetical protein
MPLTPTTLKARFKPVLSLKARKLLGTLLDHVERFEATDEGDVRCHFPEGAGTWTLLAPLPSRPPKVMARIDRHAPPGFSELLRVCGGMIRGEVGNTGQLVLSDGFGGLGGTVHALGADAIDPENFGFRYSPDLFSPIDIDSGDFYVLDPGSGRLLFQTEGCVSEVVDTKDCVEVYLREMHHELRDVREDSPFRNAFKPACHRTEWLEDRDAQED